MKNMKRNIVIGAVVLFACAAVYLNWSYNKQWGEADAAMAEAEDAAMAEAEEAYAATLEEELTGAAVQTQTQPAPEEPVRQVSAYFAEARLTRQQSRDEALSLLETAAGAEGASQEDIDSAMDEIAMMAERSMRESQLENLLVAKEFDDCVVFLSSDGVTVAVPAPPEGLSAAAVARITDAITGETEFTASQLRVIEVRDEG